LHLVQGITDRSRYFCCKSAISSRSAALKRMAAGVSRRIQVGFHLVPGLLMRLTPPTPRAGPKAIAAPSLPGSASRWSPRITWRMDGGGWASLPPSSGSMITTARPLAGGELQALDARPGLRVHIVVLNLAERPMIVAVIDVGETLGNCRGTKKPRWRMRPSRIAGLGLFHGGLYLGRFAPAFFYPERGGR